jgi:predicted aldo/keto reductase-like oxidoreductase
MPRGERAPRASHCYRFCLSHADVDLVLCGPADLEQVREACKALDEGPLSDAELAWMRRVGDHVYGRSPVRALAD